MTCCLPYKCGVWHPAARGPVSPQPLGPPSLGVKAAWGGGVLPPSLFLGGRQQGDLGEQVISPPGSWPFPPLSTLLTTMTAATWGSQTGWADGTG